TDGVLSALMQFVPIANLEGKIDEEHIIDQLMCHAIVLGETKVQEEYDPAFTSLLSGETLVFVDGCSRILVANTKGWATRGPQEPDTEPAVRGPRDSFVEVIRPNTALIRRYVRDPNLRVKSFQLGARSKTDVAIMYLDGVADDKLVNELKERLTAIKEEIDPDAIIESQNIEEIIEDSTWTVFPTIQSTERPDKAAAAVLEGRVAIVTDHTPFVMLVPTTLPMLLQAADDYYNRFPIGLWVRFLRWIGLFLGVFMPAIYIAISEYHPQVFPFNLFLTVAASRETLPFPTFIEVILMEVAIEILREATVRLPGPFGQTIGIVGGFLVGDAAVRAGLVGPLLTIVVAITAVATFTAPTYSLSIAIRLIRFLLMLAVIFAGFYGIALVGLMLLAHVCSLQSFGISYLAPISPMRVSDYKDTVLRFPFWLFQRRPESIRSPQEWRQAKPRGNWWQVMGKATPPWKEAFTDPISLKPSKGTTENPEGDESEEDGGENKKREGGREENREEDEGDERR
ncbi:MAG: spore germination protein, partial [Bacillota bacterium]